ncbi:MAG: NTP transferase domain-containing protein [Anaerolineales bacterium]|nr:NTP transferase domain-containing protein [Anaerolineales bacterium]
MKIVIPMAGYGKRLRPHTWSKPKPLVSVAGKTVLGHVLDQFATLPDIEEVIFIVGYLGDQVGEYVQTHYPHLKTRFVEQHEMSGQSHAIWLAREGLSGPMLMVFVDTLIEADLSTIPQETADAVAWVKEVPDPRRFGVAETDAQGIVHKLVEKPENMSNNLALVGFYYFKESADLLLAIKKQMDTDKSLKGEYYLADAINIMLEEGMNMRVERVDVWEDCGKPDALLQTNRYLLEHGRDNSEEAGQRESVVVIPPVYIDPTATVEASVIGPHVSIGASCTITRSIMRETIVDSESTVNDAVLEKSLIGREAEVCGSSQSLNVGDSSELHFG